MISGATTVTEGSAYSLFRHYPTRNGINSTLRSHLSMIPPLLNLRERALLSPSLPYDPNLLSSGDFIGRISCVSSQRRVIP